MTTDTVKKLLQAQPFQPFHVVMSSGDRYDVKHPEMAILTRSNLLVGLDSVDGVANDFQICSLLHISSVEPLETVESAS